VPADSIEVDVKESNVALLHIYGIHGPGPPCKRDSLVEQRLTAQ